MRFQSATVLMTLWTFVSFSLPTQAQVNRGQAQKCNAAVLAGKQRLETGRNLQVEIRRVNLSQNYPDHPANRPFNYQFVMKGKPAEAVMNSPKLMTAIAAEVIQACNSVSRVTFALANSGWYHSLGLGVNGKLIWFECLDPRPGSNQKLPWGKQYCT
jgi:hypothetical protein